MEDEITSAVIEEFNEKGLKFTMDDIARRLGISKRTLYTIVDNKDSLFIETVDCVFAAIKQSEREIVEDPTLGIMEKLKRILIVLPQKYKTLDFRQLYGLKDKFPKIYEKIENRLETEWEQTFHIMEQAMAEGKIRKISFAVFQAMVSGTIEYYISRRDLIDSGITYEKALKEMLDIIFNGILV